MRDYCKVHLARIRKNSLTKPCKGCGVGMLNKQTLCIPCGYFTARRRYFRLRDIDFNLEFKRLAAIEISC